MFESITRAVLAHKQIVIAAIAVTGLAIYAFPTSMIASAQRVIERNIEIPCLPYCNISPPADINVSAPPNNPVVIIHIHFSLVPVGT